MEPDYILKAIKNRIYDIINRDQGLSETCRPDSINSFLASVRTATELLEFIELLEKK